MLITSSQATLRVTDTRSEKWQDHIVASFQRQAVPCLPYANRMLKTNIKKTVAIVTSNQLVRVKAKTPS